MAVSLSHISDSCQLFLRLACVIGMGYLYSSGRVALILCTTAYASSLGWRARTRPISCLARSHSPISQYAAALEVRSAGLGLFPFVCIPRYPVEPLAGVSVRVGARTAWLLHLYVLETPQAPCALTVRFLPVAWIRALLWLCPVTPTGSLYVRLGLPNAPQSYD
jgi:hypothetical protein